MTFCCRTAILLNSASKSHDILMTLRLRYCTIKRFNKAFDYDYVTSLNSWAAASLWVQTLLSMNDVELQTTAALHAIWSFESHAHHMHNHIWNVRKLHGLTLNKQRGHVPHTVHTLWIVKNSTQDWTLRGWFYACTWMIDNIHSVKYDCCSALITSGMYLMYTRIMVHVTNYLEFSTKFCGWSS